MTIRTRLTLWYAAILSISLLLFGAGLFRELYEQLRHSHRPRSEERALSETGELVFQIGLPALVLGLAGGWWLTRRALSPIRALISATQRTNESNLKQPLARSGNGDELDQLTAVLNAANARLNDSFDRIRDFTLNASHELKTPLTVMHNELEMLLREGGLSTAQRDHVLGHLEEVQRLSRIVNGLILLTKADAGQVTLAKQPVRLDELVRDAHEGAMILGESRRLKVQIGACEALTVSGDRDRLRQLLLNLVDNAAKYAEPNGWVTMDLVRAEGEAKITIANSGPGIAAEALPRVFDRFYRGDPSHSNAIEGCGLGLSIAKWIVSAHGGTIRIESIPAESTTVTVRLPIEEAAEAG
jgi:signal transduction histidine kinase